MQVSRRIATVAASMVLGLSAGCGGDSSGDGLPVTRSEFEEQDLQWPFSLEEGSLHCDDGQVYFQARTGESYAVNQAAMESGDYAHPDPIWIDAPEEEDSEGASVPGKIPLADMAEYGEQEC